MTSQLHFTAGQQRVLRKTLAFTDYLIGGLWHPSDQGVRYFFAFIDRGVPIPQDAGGDTEDAMMLFGAWKLWQPGRNENSYSLQERMWLEGHLSGDYPLVWLAKDYIRDALQYPERWMAKLPAYMMLCRLRAMIAKDSPLARKVI